MAFTSPTRRVESRVEKPSAVPPHTGGDAAPNLATRDLHPLNLLSLLVAESINHHRFTSPTTCMQGREGNNVNTRAGRTPDLTLPSRSFSPHGCLHAHRHKETSACLPMRARARTCTGRSESASFCLGHSRAPTRSDKLQVVKLFYSTSSATYQRHHHHCNPASIAHRLRPIADIIEHS